ncbi:MAG TPA: hypothetical protein VGH15_13350 [Caulobacteraceae bacterium]|jgi:hypothetical protein
MKANSLVAVAIALAVACLNACSEPAGTPVVGAVLGPGQAVEATNKFGSVRVTYVSPLERRFEWDGRSRTIKLIARHEPFLGDTGLYDPAKCWVVVLTLCQTPRLVVQEATHDFDSYDQIYAFLYQGSAVMDWVYTSDGFVVGFGRSPARDQLNIDVRQLTIHGNKPVGLRGARNGSIRLVGG